MGKIALLLVDIQNDYFPGGRMEVEGSIRSARSAGELLAGFRRHGWPVIHIRHESIRPGATFFLPGSRGAEIHQSVSPLPGEQVLAKNFPNSFRDTGLLALLRKEGCTRLVVCGMMTQMCIDATVRAAFDHGFSCTVAADACAARPLSHGSMDIPAPVVHAAFLAALGGVYARVADTESILGEMVEFDWK